MQQEKQNNRELWVFLGVMALVLPILFIFTFASASDDTDLPPRPATATPTSAPPAEPTPTNTPQPIPGPSPTPTPVSNSGGGTTDSSVDGGFIQLNLSGSATGLWTEIQWLAGDGNWYTVDGWRGTVTESRQVRWYVGTDHLGAAAWFRWQVFNEPGGALLATSSAFKLPGSRMETVGISLSVP